MKNYSLPILFFLIANLSYSQDSSGTDRKELKHGIQFQILSLLELSNYDGYTLSYRYCLNRNSDIRIGLLTSIYESDSEITEQSDSVTGNPENYSHSYNFTLSIQYLSDLLTHKDFSLLIGGGPFASYSKGETTSEDISLSYLRSIRRNEESFGYGLNLIAAVEYSLTDNVLISGEYGLIIEKENADIENIQSYIYTDGNPNRFNKEDGKINRFTISGSGVNLGIAVFF